jgi:hypothetical protein
MLTIFRTNQQLANIFLLLYLAVLHFSVWQHPPTEIPEAHGMWTQLWYKDFSPLSMWSHLVVVGLIFLQAVFLNLLMARYRVSSEVSMLPGLFYCYFASMMPDFLVLSPILLANTFLILSTLYLFDVYKNNSVAGRVFDVGLWLGVAALFHFGYNVFYLWGIIGLGILRGLNLKELLMYTIGFIVPYLLFGTYLFWTDRFPMFINHFTENFALLSFEKSNTVTLWVKLGLFFLFILLAFFGSAQLSAKRSIATQKYIGIFYWMLLTSILSVLIVSGININVLMIFSVPLGVIFSMLFLRIGPATAEALHMLLLGVALIMQFEHVVFK